MQAAQVRGYEVGEVLYMAMELSNRRWKLGFSNGTKVRRKSIDARDRQRFLEETFDLLTSYPYDLLIFQSSSLLIFALPTLWLHNR